MRMLRLNNYFMIIQMCCDYTRILCLRKYVVVIQVCYGQAWYSCTWMWCDNTNKQAVIIQVCYHTNLCNDYKSVLLLYEGVTVIWEGVIVIWECCGYMKMSWFFNLLATTNEYRRFFMWWPIHTWRVYTSLLCIQVYVFFV